MQPRISVVMPYYNSSMTVANAISSVVEQTEKDWELIIVNDGSTAGHSGALIQIVSRFKDERIKVHHRPHLGIVEARNYGNSISQAEFIAIQDADDLSMPDRLQKSLEHMPGHDVLVHSGYLNMWAPKWHAMNRTYKHCGYFDRERIKKEQFLPGWPIFRKSLWKNLPFRSETQHAYDWMMHIDWMLSNAEYTFLDIGQIGRAHV